MTDAIERVLELPVDLDTLWSAVTEPATLQSWLADEVAWELEPGGEARFVLEGRRRDGWVEEVSEPQHGRARLAFWWQGDDEPASRVVIELAETLEGTRLRVVEHRPLEVLDVIGIPLGGAGGHQHGPAMVCA